LGSISKIIMNFKLSIPDPIRGLTLHKLNQQLDAYANGQIADFAFTADVMETRDDILMNVILKRKKAVARHPWEILMADASPEARRHHDALRYFYDNIRCAHALKEDAVGGVHLLVQQMMDALAKGWAVHEITWQPVSGLEGGRVPTRKAGSDLCTASLRFVPLWFFENRTARLRFNPQPGAMQGEPMREREWLVTTGDALMLPCARAFLFKHLPLQLWLEYCQRYGRPGIRGVTAAARDLAEWNTFAESVDSFLTDLTVVTSSDENIELIDRKGSGEPPFAKLIERMDRVMASIWRGADLSTISRDRGYGASLQEEEARILETQDARMISETLNETLDRWVIQYLFGEGVIPKAYFHISMPEKDNTAQDLAIDQFLIEHGVELDMVKTLERYGRTAADPGHPSLGKLIGKNAHSANRSYPPRTTDHNHLTRNERAQPTTH
jgi:phage gp29-like protein